MTLGISCAAPAHIPLSNVTSLLQMQEFTFVAQRANPVNLDVINALPNGSASRLLNLDPGYTIEITKDELQVTLPYFGRMYNADMSGKNSYRFTSKDFTVNKKEGKKGSTIFMITTKDQQNVNNINMEVFSNGKAYVSIDANDRQPISYDGYITANSAEK